MLAALREFALQQPPEKSLVVQIGANTHSDDNFNFLSAGRIVTPDHLVRFAISRGWHALLVEPAPHSYAALSKKYAQEPNVRTQHAAVCPVTAGVSGCAAPPQRFLSLDLQNGTGTMGSDDADVRCVLGQFGSKDIWISQLASFSRASIMKPSSAINGPIGKMTVKMVM